ncbi:MAG TPA: proline iminopeptidase-family hydrolase [Chitinophagaceae bacterium]|nr:proline iminopeptidase-family hydrolase [Chitinophagaceae bacterium]
MKPTALLSICIVVLLYSSCKQSSTDSAASPTLAEYYDYRDSGVQSGGVRMVPIQTPVGNFKVWTKRFGNNPRIKVLLLHGGPAFTHEYFECFESYFPKEGFEFYEYDQLGSYYSDQPKDSSLWTTARFVEEVEQVRQALGLTKDNFYLFGNSWGGILAMEYALKYQDNLKGLIISNMMASIPDYEKYNGILRSKMRPSLIDTLSGYESRGDFKNPVYQEMVFNEYYTKHLCRLPEWPEPLLRSMKHLNEEIYVMMQGPSEFKVGGRLLTWDRKADLPKIKVPTLTVGAQFDTMDPEHMKWMSTRVQNGNYLHCPNGSHCSFWDDQEHFFPGVIKFIKDVDEGSFKAAIKK